MVALLAKAYYRLSYERVVQLFDLIGIVCPRKSALQAMAAKLDSKFWQQVLKATSPKSYLVALDATGLSLTNPSYHYLKCINGKKPQKYVKLSAAFDTRHKKFCAASIRVLPAHDLKDANKLIQQCNPRIEVADKGYVSEKLYKQAHEQDILLMIPKKKNAKRGFYRKKMHKSFRKKTYNRRSLVEAVFGAAKRKYGSSVSSRKARTIRTEVLSRLACHNLFSYLFQHSG